MPSNQFSVGSIVTLKSHPLFRKHSIDIFSSQVPPLMIVKEVFFEDEKKKIFSDQINNIKIADNIKYVCVYFNNNKSEFIEITVYHSFIRSYRFLKYHREKDSDNKETKSPISLIDEVKTYKPAEYNFGDVVQFKTNKLEKRKKFIDVKDIGVKISFTSPDFILTGLKKENLTDLFYHDGKPKRKASEILYKVMWYNHFQQKFSEQYLPQECFIENIEEEDSTLQQSASSQTNPAQNISGAKDFDQGAN